MMGIPREIRIRQLHDFFDGKWHTRPQAIVRLGDVGKWTMVRVASFPNACPFVLSRKDWDKLPVESTTPSQGVTHDPQG